MSAQGSLAEYAMQHDWSSFFDAFGITALVLGLFWLGLRSKSLSRFFPAQPERISSIDGLRGFLALAVLFSHLLSFRTYLRTGEWTFPGHFFEFAPVTAVQLFFCITGFLFWSKAIRRKGRLDVKEFYVRRFLRIFPLYVAVVAATAATLMAHGRGALSAADFESAAQLLYPRTASGDWPTIRGQTPFFYLAQCWTLAFEVCFYAIFPVLAWIFARSLKSFVAFLPVALAILLIGLRVSRLEDLAQCAPFLVGMISAEVVERKVALSFLRGIGGTVLVVAGLAVLYMHHSKFSDVMLLLCFVPIAAGNTLFGLLAWKPCRALGDISYSVYLIHLLAIHWLVFAWPYSVAGASVRGFWLFGTLSVLATVLCSLVTYRLFEEPFMRSRGSFSQVKPALAA
ncbi:MAG TPA: acyltransferase [Fimbriimonas sp.]|nr:acyltransferase [Fimbriimonas sp.]